MVVSNGEQPKGLESKWWYRLLRVTLLTLYGLAVIPALYLIYDGKRPYIVTDSERSLIVCDDGGKTYSLAAIGATASVSTGQLDDGYLYTANVTCNKVEPTTNSFVPDAPVVVDVRMPDGTLIRGVPKGTRKYEVMLRYQRWRRQAIIDVGEVEFRDTPGYAVKVAFKTEGSWAKALSYMAIAWVLIHVALVIVRGAVLYVAVGRFLPVAGFRGWLVL